MQSAAPGCKARRQDAKRGAQTYRVNPHADDGGHITITFQTHSIFKLSVTNRNNPNQHTSQTFVTTSNTPQLPCYTPDTMNITQKIDPMLKKRYLARELTSIELGELTGYHPAHIRKYLPRPPRLPAPTKGALIAARARFRATLAHLPAQEIAARAHVSMTTAQRIKKKYRDNA